MRVVWQTQQSKTYRLLTNHKHFAANNWSLYVLIHIHMHWAVVVLVLLLLLSVNLKSWSHFLLGSSLLFFRQTITSLSFLLLPSHIYTHLTSLNTSNTKTRPLNFCQKKSAVHGFSGAPSNALSKSVSWRESRKAATSGKAWRISWDEVQMDLEICRLDIGWMSIEYILKLVKYTIADSWI